MKMIWVYIIFLISSLGITIDIYSKDLGQKGVVYPIQEKSLLKLIYQKLNEKQKNGGLDILQKEFQEKVKTSIEKPSGANIWSAIKSKRWLFDPSLTLKKDISNHEGNIVARQGSKVNPLNYIKLSKELIFINADNKNEIKFAKKKLSENINNKIILVNGNIKDANIEIGNEVYFDQEAKLISKFGIEHTPAVVSQKDEYLQIEEVAL